MRQRIIGAVARVLEKGRELGETFHNDRQLLKISFVGLVVVSGSGLLCAKLLDDVMGGDGAVRADPAITNWIVRHRSPTLTTLARAVTHLGDPLSVIVIAAAAALALILGRHSRFALLIVSSTVGAAVATAVTKFAVQRPRPDRALWLSAATGPAFPSGHATQSVALYAVLAVIAFRLTARSTPRIVLIVVAPLVALSVGASRIYLAVHWTSDVICGWAVATTWLATLLLVEWAGPRALEDWGGREPLPR